VSGRKVRDRCVRGVLGRFVLMSYLEGSNLRVHSLDEGVQGGQGGTCQGVVVCCLLEETVKLIMHALGVCEVIGLGCSPF